MGIKLGSYANKEIIITTALAMLSFMDLVFLKGAALATSEFGDSNQTRLDL